MTTTDNATTPARAPGTVPALVVPDCQHDWQEVYYGVKCYKCGQFYAHGCTPWEDPGDDYYDDEDNRCERCCGEGFVEYNDAPDTWGEDCPSEVNHLVRCPDCRGTGEQRRHNAPVVGRERSERTHQQEVGQ